MKKGGWGVYWAWRRWLVVMVGGGERIGVIRVKGDGRWIGEMGYA